MSPGRHRSKRVAFAWAQRADFRWAVGLLVGFVLFVAVLARATGPMVTVLWAVSFHNPGVYVALLALLVGLPGLLFTLPRVRAPRTIWVRRATRRSQVTRRRRTHLRTDVLGWCALLLAQVPLPAPWGPHGKAATIANLTRVPEVVELSRAFATLSLAVFGVGIGAAVLAHVYRHVPVWRVAGLMLALGAAVGAWAWVTHTVL